MQNESTLPFPLGGTLFDGSPGAATDGDHILGQEYQVRDTIHGVPRVRKVRAVRNSAGFAVLPKRLAILNALGTAILGYTRLPEEKGAPIDESLPVAGVATNDICWVVVMGPAICLTSLSNYGADIAAGIQSDRLNSQTAATSGATTAGRVDVRAVVAGTADATGSQRNVTEQDGVFGRAMSAALTNATNADILCDVGSL